MLINIFIDPKISVMFLERFRRNLINSSCEYFFKDRDLDPAGLRIRIFKKIIFHALLPKIESYFMLFFPFYKLRMHLPLMCIC